MSRPVLDEIERAVRVLLLQCTERLHLGPIPEPKDLIVAQGKPGLSQQCHCEAPLLRADDVHAAAIAFNGVLHSPHGAWIEGMCPEKRRRVISKPSVACTAEHLDGL